MILKPVPSFSWKTICAVSVIGFYAMPGSSDAYISEYLRRVGESAHSLLEFVRKDVAADATLEWKTGGRTMQQMVAMGATADPDSTWAVIVGINAEFATDSNGSDEARSFGDAWLPRFSSIMQFYAPFDDAPNLPILEGDPTCALVLHR